MKTKTVVEAGGKSVYEIKLDTGVDTWHLLGTSPIILHRMSEKAKQELLMPKGKKTAADKAGSLKHDPIQEYRDAPYVTRDPKGDPYFQMLATAVKACIREAALIVPGAKKTEVGRLTWVEGEFAKLWGAPQLLMSVVRMADMNKTPDIRTRCILPEWAMKVSISYVKPHLNSQDIASLLTAAGLAIGLGDWRPQKGSGSFGQFRVVDPDDKDFVRIMKTQGRPAQVEGLKTENPTCYDIETEEMLEWFKAEHARRTGSGGTRKAA